MIIPKDVVERKDYKACADFHGHTCMGLTLGYMAAKLALQNLREKRSVDEELICIAETDACACDAIQVLTGCTFGKGNFIYRDVGKMAFTFASRTTGEGVRLAMRPGIMTAPEQEQLLTTKIGAGEASKEEIKEYEALYEARSQILFDGGPEAFFTSEEVVLTLPQKARMAPSKPCDGCGEPVMHTKLQSMDGKQFCRDCSAHENITPSI